jgi:KDO2-lipid IV(A) lauroyltransferase
MPSRLRFLTFVDYMVFLLVRLLEEVLHIIPESAALALGRFMGRVVFVLFPDRKDAALENLNIAFGNEKSHKWIYTTARKSFEHVGLLAAEFFLIRRWDQKKMSEKIILDGSLPYNLAMMPGNHGILLLTSHFGCFEVSAITIKYLGVRVGLIATGLKNPFLSQYFSTRGGGEEATGIKFYPHKGSAKSLIKTLREGNMVACLADQRGDAERGIFVNFFGKTAPANEIFARFSIDGEAVVLPLCTFRRDDGRYQSVFGEHVRLKLTGDTRKDLTAVSQQFHDLFEQWLRFKPEQGFWLHRKWRRKPSRRRAAARGRAVPVLPGNHRETASIASSGAP